MEILKPKSVELAARLKIRSKKEYWSCKYYKRLAEEPDPDENIFEEQSIVRLVSRLGLRCTFARNAEDLRTHHLSLPSTSPTVNWSYTPGVEVSRTALKDMLQISLSQLYLRVQMRGTFVVLRTMESAKVRDGEIFTVVEDDVGTGAIFCLRNYITKTDLNLDEVLPKATVFILKEPFCRESFDGDCVLRCENPSDMILVPKGHELSIFTTGILWCNYVVDPLSVFKSLHTAADWRERGNRLFLSEKYLLALNCYYMALPKISYEDNPSEFLITLHVNFCEAFLKRRSYESVLKYAEKVLAVEPTHRTALGFAARACYPLRRYRDALEHLNEFGRYNVFDRDTHDVLERIKKRLAESETGKYNMHDFFMAEVQQPKTFVDCADYTGPIKLITIEGQGSGVVATSQVEPGTLLVVSKAIGMSWTTNTKKQPTPVRWRRLTVAIAQLIAQNPNTFGPMVYSLCDGRDLTPEAPRVFCAPDAEFEPIVDIDKLVRIVSRNSLCDGKSYFKTGFGLFHWPSFFNYSCLPNASFHKFNDIIFIRAIRSIAEGEEIYIPCLSSDAQVPWKIKLCSRRGCRCGCLSCQLERLVPQNVQSKQKYLWGVFQGMHEMISEEKIKMKKVPMFIRDVGEFINEMKAAYKDVDPSTQRVALASAYSMLAKAYSISSGRQDPFHEKQIDCHIMILRIYGFSPQDMFKSLETGACMVPPDALINENVLSAVERLVVIYGHSEKNEYNIMYKERWLKVLLALENVYSGGDLKVLKSKYVDIIPFLPVKDWKTNSEVFV